MPQNKDTLARPRKNERGNVFIFILVGVVLFATLSFTIARGFRSDTTTRMSGREASLAATDILAYTQQISRAVDRLRRKGISENDLSFDNPTIAGYNHTPAQPADNQVFNPAGGAMRWLSPQAGVNDGSEWLITAETCIPNIGTGAANCNSDSISNEELIIALPNLDTTVCEEINTRLNIAAILVDSGSGIDTTQFQGNFSDGTEINVTDGPFETACFSSGGNNFFYSVLIAR